MKEKYLHTDQKAFLIQFKIVYVKPVFLKLHKK